MLRNVYSVWLPIWLQIEILKIGCMENIQTHSGENDEKCTKFKKITNPIFLIICHKLVQILRKAIFIIPKTFGLKKNIDRFEK